MYDGDLPISYVNVFPQHYLWQLGDFGAERGCGRRPKNLNLGEDVDGGVWDQFKPWWVALCAHKSENQGEYRGRC